MSRKELASLARFSRAILNTRLPLASSGDLTAMPIPDQPGF
jgi:hypothetical protein